MKPSTRRALVLATALAISPFLVSECTCNDADEANKRRATIALKVRGLIDKWYKKSAAVDLKDGKDNFNEDAIKKRLLDYLAELKKTDPQRHQRYMLQLASILDRRKALDDDGDIGLDNTLLDPPNLKRILDTREKSTSADGTVKFQSKEDEKRLSLADLTPDAEILFESANPAALDRMGITATGPFPCFRVTEDTEANFNGKKVIVKKGTFVVKTQEGNLYRVIVLNGDRIIDSLSEDFSGTGDDTKTPKAPTDFEKFLQLKMPDFSANQGRKLFHSNFKDYKGLLTGEYKHLLVKNGISFEKGFVYYLQWCKEMKIPVNEASMRQYFETFERAQKAKEKKEGWGSKMGKKVKEIFDKATDFNKSGVDQDENNLSYQDERVTDPSQAADIARKKYSTLFAIVRLQGSFFDNFTYNRLSGNYSARVGAAVYGKKEYLQISDLASSIGRKTPKDVVRKVKRRSSFAERLNKTTNFNHGSDSKLREALAFSHNALGGGKVAADAFTVAYAANGSIAGVALNGKPYEPGRFITSPNNLRQLPSDTVTVKLGGVSFRVNINQYFKQYHALEAKNKNVSQNVMYYDTKTGKKFSVRNMMWFVEKNEAFYKPIAEQITSGVSSPTGKVLALANWLQVNLEYIDEISEINKIALGTFWDNGGDCEDSTISLKTLASSIGLGHLVAAVVFENHIAPLVRGDHGPVKHTDAQGNKWTIVELATPLGKPVKPGVTRHNNPRIVMFDESRMATATGRYIPLKMVPLDQLDRGLVDTFNKEVQKVDQLIAKNKLDPKNPPSTDQLTQLQTQIHGVLKSLSKAYSDIARTGKMAKEVSDKYRDAGKRMSKLIEQGGKLLQSQADAKTRKLLQGQPEKVKAEIREYLRLQKEVAVNVKPLNKELDKIFKGCQGKEKDYNAMVQCRSDIIDAVNARKVTYNFSVMQNIHYRVMRHIPSADKYALKVQGLIAKLINSSIYGRLNPVNRVISAHENE